MARQLTDGEVAKLAAGRAHLLRIRPYFASAALAMETYAQDGLGTFSVDARWRLYVDPRRLDDWSAAEVGAVLEHELGHLLRDHHGRGAEVPVPIDRHDVWNLACDAAINDDLLAEGRPLPGSPIMPSSLGLEPYRSEEDYYGALSATPLGSFSIVHGLVDCGSAAGGPARWYEVSTGGLGTTEIETIRRTTAAEIVRAGAGASLPWRRWATSFRRVATVDWRTLLAGSVAALVAGSGRDLRSYRRADRRAHDQSIVSKGWLRSKPSVAIAVDSSGSMSPSALGLITGELRGLDRSGVVGDAMVIVCDDAVRSVEPLTQFCAESLCGGGGTDMRVALAEAERLHFDANVVFTDGETPWPGGPPATPTLVVLVGATQPARKAVPRWARVVELDASSDALIPGTSNTGRST